MTNILLTNKCVRQCPYCFASSEMSRTSTNDFISWENIVYLADFLQLSGSKRVSLIGGEPTLHPEFIDILLYFLERKFDVTVFTSGVVSKSKLRDLETYIGGTPARQLTFMCNVNDPRQTIALPRETETQERFLSRLAQWTMLGFNIYRKDFRLDFLFDLFGRHNLKNVLRIGITHPIPDAHNDFIRIEDIGDVIARLHSYRDDFNRVQVAPNLDCGFPLCRLSDEQIGWLVRLGGQANFTCRPVIDITPDMEVYACFPLAAVDRRSLFEFDSLQAVTDHFAGLHARLRAERHGIYDECADCRHRKNGICAAGGACQIACGLRAEPSLESMGAEA